MKFKIEQIAIAPYNPEIALELLRDIGMVDWIDDVVTATGSVFNLKDVTNKTNLHFNYDAFDGKEFEVLDYFEGVNWVENSRRKNSVSHLGMHCSADELVKWKAFFADRNIGIAQEVFTDSHTNEYLIKNGRKYNYVIFNTLPILGVDLKFIVRIDKKVEEQAVNFGYGTTCY